jgi:hypothetical protein
MWTTHEPLHLRRTKFRTVKNSGRTYKFIWAVIFSNGPLEYGSGEILKLLRWTQNKHHSTLDHNILYADRSLEDKQLLISPLLRG